MLQISKKKCFAAIWPLWTVFGHHSGAPVSRGVHPLSSQPRWQYRHAKAAHGTPGMPFCDTCLNLILFQGFSGSLHPPNFVSVKSAIFQVILEKVAKINIPNNPYHGRWYWEKVTPYQRDFLFQEDLFFAGGSASLKHVQRRQTLPEDAISRIFFVWLVPKTQKVPVQVEKNERYTREFWCLEDEKSCLGVPKIMHFRVGKFPKIPGL